MKYFNRMMTLMEAAAHRDETPTKWRMHPEDRMAIQYSARQDCGHIELVNAGIKLMGLPVVETTECPVGEIQLATL